MDWSVSRSRWRKRTQRSKPLFLLSLAFLFLFLFLFLLLLLSLSTSSSLFRSLLPFASSPLSTTQSLTSQSAQCGGRAPDLAGQRFLWYAPHSGFSNQVGELKNAIVIAAILNRTLIVPPVLDHHAVALGSCPKFRVSSPTEIRVAVWDHVMELVRDRRYVSMADIVDLSSIAPTMVKTIDFRVFASMWCGIDIKEACFAGLCCAVSGLGSSSGNFEQCRSLISGLQGSIDHCIYAVEEDCRTAVWTYQQNNDGVLDSFQPDKELQRKKKISYIRKRKDVYNALGPGSKAETATILAFGTLFSSPYRGSQLYIDIHEPLKDFRIQSSLKEIEFLPFVPEIVDAGKEFAVSRIKEPFLCAQLRLLDGQFKNHWKTTFSALQQKLKSIELEIKANQVTHPISIFIMTDLPRANWTRTYLEEIAKSNMYKLYTLQENDELVLQAARSLMAAEHGLRSGYLPRIDHANDGQHSCHGGSLPDILLYVEESVCSCASLGFVGTAGSTIAESIGVMRRNNVCKL
ncbi:O-fucosyltransferase 30 [Typha angustifolia]|uniref:O-fucosyltransferase 30 n=1 Tax=Typha angustifolia TaxID=59011 RepID=UPI003C2EF4B4